MAAETADGLEDELPDARIRALLEFLADDPRQAAVVLEHERRALLLMARSACAQFGRGVTTTIDPEDTVHDTFLRVGEVASRRTLTRENVGGFLCRTLYNVVREAVRDRRPELPIDVVEPIAREPDEERLRIGYEGRCFAALRDEERELLRDYYGNDSPRDREELAARLRTTGGALRVRIHKLRRRLFDCVARCRNGEGVRI